jgi:uncharacterized membrane protein
MSSANDRLPKGLFLLLAVGASLYFSHYYSLLPHVVASHFERHGIVNGWQTKQAFFELFDGMTLLGTFLVFGVPAIIAITPAQLINLPNKGYWLGREQRPASMRFLSTWFAWFGCAVYFVIITAYDFAVQTNLHSPRGANPAPLWYVLAFFAAFTVIWTIRLFARFGRVPGEPQP